MAKRSSWADRRWKLFEHTYKTNSGFRETLANVPEADDTFNYVASVLQTYKVPLGCVNAVIAFINNPALKRDDYLALILSPITFWSMSADIIRPNQNERATNVFNKRFKQRGISLTENGKEINSGIAAEIISGGHLMLQLGPYLNKSEIKEIIDEYWDELEPLLKVIDGTQDPTAGLELRGKIQPTKIKRAADRDALIMQLHDAGMNNAQIATYIMEHTDYAQVTTEYIRVIRHRNKPHSD